MSIPNWSSHVRRGGGFWSDGRWYDLHLERRMPLALPMLEELRDALPPLPAGTRVCDLACGTGNGAVTVLSAYPEVHITLLDEDPDLLSVAREKVDPLTLDVEVLQTTIDTDGEAIPGGPYDVVIASLALHAIVGHDVERAEAESRYELLFRSIADGLVSGGHCFVGDHVGTLPLFAQLKAMERAGFRDVDCAWRQDDFFVAAGRLGE
ncbi:methyltransferase [Longibacter salinarum]|uniref:Methyltransferase n=1 Tax=Longibacter salinarum TaxID=1850348 RepID=A0A2A8CUT9_9BACT|nr:class I SAM-dependent methyltransferase [Longibacter salinarum]PEN11311.1 methyltransferase [Longibacter salinarum]